MLLRARITLVVVAAATLAIALTAFMAYRNVGELFADELERGLEDRADTVVALLVADRQPPVRAGMTEQLLHGDGTVREDGGVRLPVSEAARRVAATGAGTAREDVVVAGTEYGVLTRALPGGGAVMVGQSYREAERVDRAFLGRILGTTAAATAVAALLSWIALGRVLRPVSRLARAARRITTTQDLATPLPPAGRDEIGQLTRSFDTMLGALRRSRAQQQRLVQDAGHELRTPLTSVRGSAELLQRARGRLAPEDEQQILTTLVTETVALDDLVRELVELATDRWTGEEPEEVDLAVAAEESARRCRQRTGRAVEVTADAPVPVRARPRAVQRCVDNLLSNAVKFSPAGTPVTVRVDGSRLSVGDRGPGIPPGEHRAVFDRFHRGPGTQGTPGSGLGLAIVHDLVTADGGTVFAGTAEGGGALVGFVLPSAAPPARRSARQVPADAGDPDRSATS
ncbi:HAMP domain-containing sensor histidine kinase [Streptomyces sp. WAC06614]|uniref:HAMP domain-containing sensor histidine kinase n=1 Tax=Streptomyces sp. WAC06614 TaxID=2487416 RepID=UPI000F795A93|nr:HAMP domain-containing sensor histidine kinase [Streptomyces sp. WAC06614]RSS81375.1 sensor histidine kinase [Streptomyces sp. WAC06614]